MSESTNWMDALNALMEERNRYEQWLDPMMTTNVPFGQIKAPVLAIAGGRDCIWSGMNSGSVTTQARSFRDLREITKRAEIMMLDHQRRDDDTGFQQNGDTGKRVHSILGWDKLAPESMAMYQAGAVPSWCIMDSRHRRYRWGGYPPGEPPAKWL